VALIWLISIIGFYTVTNFSSPVYMQVVLNANELFLRSPSTCTCDALTLNWLARKHPEELKTVRLLTLVRLLLWLKQPHWSQFRPLKTQLKQV
jgi:hypothetical protein